MSIYKRGGVYWYKFHVAGVCYRASTGQRTRQDAELVEGKAKLAVRRRLKGIDAPDAGASPAFQDWAETYYEYVAPRLSRPEAKEDLLRSVLRFWGRTPTDPKKVKAGAPYHDLRLADVVADPYWIVRWETWMDGADLAPQTKNHYRSTLHDMFRVATAPQWRGRTGVTINPFAGQWRDPTPGREVALDRQQLTAVIAAAAPHLQLAIAIAVLAPKLRLANILSLRWDTHVSPDFRYLTVHDHKTARKTKRPLVVYVPDQLERILRAVHGPRRRPRYPWVVTYRGRRVSEVRGAIQGAVRRATAAGVPLTYGRAAEHGITFHTLRHTAATLLAELEVAPEKRQQVMGHRNLATTMRYTHLRPVHEREPAERLSAALPEIEGLIIGRRTVPETVPSRRRAPAESFGKSRTADEASDPAASDQTVGG